jgi:hypothetical protein
MALVLGAVLSVCFPQRTWAAQIEITAYDGHGTVSWAFRKLPRSAAFAELYLAPRDASFRTDLGEDDVMRMGCRFKATSPEDIASLVEIVASADVGPVFSRKGAYDGYDARVVVRVYQSDAHYVSLVLSPDSDNVLNGGEYVQVDGDRKYASRVDARSGIERNLRFWAAQHLQTAVKPCHDPATGLTSQ